MYSGSSQSGFPFKLRFTRFGRPFRNLIDLRIERKLFNRTKVIIIMSTSKLFHLLFQVLGHPFCIICKKSSVPTFPAHNIRTTLLQHHFNVMSSSIQRRSNIMCRLPYNVVVWGTFKIKIN